MNVLTDGVYDLLHANHVAFLEEARSQGDRLVVAVVSDRIAETFKRRPVIHEDERLAVVAALSCVDEAFILDEPMDGRTMTALLERYRIGAVVYAGDATPEFYVPAEERGIMRRLPYRRGISSSAIIESIVSRRRDGDL